jgi:hypothetical protein
MFKMKAIRATVAAALLGATGAASAAVITLDFEGVGNFASINNFYNGGTDSRGNSGTNYGVAFNSNALGLVDGDVGGSGNFGNEPTPDTVLFFTTGSAILNYAPGFTTGFSFFYSTVNFGGTVSVYDDINATGNLIGTISLAPLGAGSGDPTGQYSNWAAGSLGFSGTAKSIDFGGTVEPSCIRQHHLRFDPPDNTVPEPTTLALLSGALLGVLLCAAARPEH